jgi:hypothetical protein
MVAEQPAPTVVGGAPPVSAISPGLATTNVTEPLPYTNEYSGAYTTPDLTEVFRFTHIEGDGQGDVPAFTHFGFTKYVWGPGGVLMIDAGARVTNEAEGGFSLGMQRRILLGDAILGGGAFFDWQEDFQQVSLPFELFTQNWSFRANGYFVVGNDVETHSEYERTGATAVFFQGNNIRADNLLLIEDHDVALSGVDFEVARHIGLASECYCGGYLLDGELDQNTVGAKAGLRGFLAPYVAANVNIAHDDLFGTNVYGGLTWFVGARRGMMRPNMTRMLTIPVERNEQVAVAKLRTEALIAGPIVLTHDDDPIEIVHVEAGAGGANEGPFEDPFDALPATQSRIRWPKTNVFWAKAREMYTS